MLPVRQGGRCYLQMMPPDGARPDKRTKAARGEIPRRLDEFAGYLQRHKAQPKLIDICRSRWSGFTPKDQWETIERGLLDRLRSLFSIETHLIHEYVDPLAILRENRAAPRIKAGSRARSANPKRLALDADKG